MYENKINLTNQQNPRIRIDFLFRLILMLMLSLNLCSMIGNFINYWRIIIIIIITNIYKAHKATASKRCQEILKILSNTRKQFLWQSLSPSPSSGFQKKSHRKNIVFVRVVFLFFGLSETCSLLILIFHIDSNRDREVSLENDWDLRERSEGEYILPSHEVASHTTVLPHR